MTRRADTKLAKLARLRGTFRNWPRVLADHLGIVRGRYVCRMRDGVSFEVRAGTDDRHVLFEIFVQKIYATAIAPGAVVIDIGANIGGFTVWAAHRGARVIAYEPFAENYLALRRNVRRNRLTATLVRAAVRDAAGTSELFLPSDEGHSGRYSVHPGRGNRTIPVSCVSLDAVFAEHALEGVDLLKIDCQGSEYEILYGASADTLSKTRAIIVECERFPERADWSLDALRRHLEGVGFATDTRGSLLYATRAAAGGAS
ncbi:MAG: FkbM family methyltransferase [Gemmatimonadaceae bacterium]